MKKRIWLGILVPTLLLTGLLGWGMLRLDGYGKTFATAFFGGEEQGQNPPAQEALEGNAAETEGGALAGQVALDQDASEGENSSVEAPPDPEEPSEVQETFQEYDVTLMALGDNLMHMGIVYTGRLDDGSYEYSCLFDDLSEYLEAADLSMINQETIFGGNELGFSGFPHFNSPTQVGDAIAGAGFSVVLHATNHAADQGIRGIYHCADFWKQHPEVLMTGIAGEEGMQGIPLVEAGGITFAILNYTYGPNMGTFPSELRGHLNMLCDYNQATGAIDFTKLSPQVTADIQEAGSLADIVVVCPHWGTEYQKEPSSYQRSFAAQMAQAGADLIIGTHPHVPQPVEWVEGENGHRALCFYSLGNYVSTQKQALCMLEGMAWVTFHVTEDGVALSEEDTGVLPLVCHYKSGPVRFEHIYPLEEYTEELAGKHGIRSYGGVVLRLSDLQTWSREIFGEWALDREEILGGKTKSENLP